MNIFFYGNCQTSAVLNTLSLPNNYNVTHIECWKEHIDRDNFTNIIKNSDIIITQPINDNYRDVDYLSTSFIIKNKKEICKLIIFDSCYFNFYYFDLTYKKIDGELLRKPIDYHYNKMIECYLNNSSMEYYISNYVNNVDLKSKEELDTIALNSLNELKHRNEKNCNKYDDIDVYMIETYEFIKNNYKDKLLFYSMNHPTKYVIQFICEKIVEILPICTNINYTNDFLSNPSCILYKCISKNVNFDIDKQELLTGYDRDVKGITRLYYDTYKEIGLKESGLR